MKHGTRWGYIKGCDCEACVQANRDYQRDYLRKRRRQGLVDNHGRRIRD